MREERGTISGDVVVHEPYTLWGTILGNVRVIDGAKFYIRGMVYGNVDVEPGGRMHLFGRISGKVHIGRGTKVILSGVVGGDVTNEGGRLYLDEGGIVDGKIRTRAGETKML